MKLSLLHKLLALFLGIFVAAAAGLTYFAYLTSRDAMRLEFQIRGRTLAKAIASESRLYYQRADVEGFTTLLQALGETQGVLAVLAYRASRELWVETAIIELAPQELGLPAVQDEWEQETILGNKDRVAEFISPIVRTGRFQGPNATHAPVGWIRVVVDRQPLETRLDQMVVRTIFVGGLVVLAGALVFTYLLRRSLRVIGPLTEATRLVAEGNLQTTVPVAGDDELGELAACFNRMTERLLLTTVSRNYVTNIVESLTDMLIVTDLDGSIRTVNRAAVKLLGYPTQDLVGQSIRTVIPAEETLFHEIFSADTVHVGAVEHRSTTYQARNGRAIPVLLSVTVIRDNEGAVQGIACVAQDRTTLAEVEERLRLQGTALESAANAVVITDAQGTITWVNPAFTELTGYTPGEVFGQTMRILRSGQHEDAFYRALWSTILAGQVWQGEIINRRKDGTIYTEEETITPVADSNGTITHFIAIKRDVTERKKAQTELQRMNAQLQEIDQLRVQFFADISHELRTPLTVIRGEAEVTLRGKDKPVPEYRTVLGRIVHLSNQMNKLVGDLLFLARSESGTVQIDMKPTSLPAILGEVHQEAGILARPKEVTVTLNGQSGPVSVQGDAERLKQLFMILMDNAIKYGRPHGSIAVRLSTEGPFARVAVTDNGLGIPGEDLPHVFKRFYRVRRGRAAQVGGAGLGLPIAKWLVEAHSGTIAIASEPDKGTTVTVQLPLSGDRS